MVRLQKIAYERIVNTKALHRARTIITPMKWFTTNPMEHQQRLSYDFFLKHPIGRFLAPFYRYWHNKERDYQRDILLQQGLTFEDKYLHHDSELRRDVLFEHMFRESLHPYHWVLKTRRRERYYRIERGLRGFFVPEFIRSEAQTQTWLDYKGLLKTWWQFIHNNYYSDMTPFARRSVVPFIFPIQLMLNFGIWRPEAWERYFFNTRDPEWYTEKDVKEIRDPKVFPYDLRTPQGKKDFEVHVTDLNDKHPGLVAPQGQKFDFKKHYAELGV